MNVVSRVMDDVELIFFYEVTIYRSYSDDK